MKYRRAYIGEKFFSTDVPGDFPGLSKIVARKNISEFHFRPHFNSFRDISLNSMLSRRYSRFTRYVRIFIFISSSLSIE